MLRKRRNHWFNHHPLPLIQLSAHTGSEYIVLRWQSSHLAEVNENIKLGYSQDQGYP